MIERTIIRVSCLPTLAILAFLSPSSLADPQQTPPARPKRVITNEDLQKYQEKSNAELKAAGVVTEADPKRQEAISAATTEGKVQSRVLPSTGERDSFQAKLKEADDAFQKTKRIEENQIKALSGFKKSLVEAETDFARQTAAWQIEDTQTNLARATANRKKAEEHRAKLFKETQKKSWTH